MSRRPLNKSSRIVAPFEALEDRRLCSATTPAGSAIADQIRTSAALAGVSDQVLEAALKTASSGTKADADKAQRQIITAGLGLPADAAKSKLSNTQLVRQASDLGLIGAQDKVTNPDYWKTVRQLGADFALAGAVRESMVIPVAETQGKNARQILDDAADIALLGASASSPKAWKGLALLKAGKISVDQFTADFADGKDVVNQAKVVADQAALRGKVRAEINARNADKAKSQPTNGYNPQTDIATDKNYGNGIPYVQPTADTNEAPAGTDPNGAEFTINGKTTHSDGTVAVSWTMTVGGQTSDYTTVYYSDGWYEVYDSEGGWVGTGNGTPPADDTVGTTTQTTDGDQAIFPSESTTSNTDNSGGGDNQSNDQDGDGTPDSQDDDADGNGTPDNQEQSTEQSTADSAAPADADDGAATGTDPQTSGTPNPETHNPDPAARQNWLTNTPFGQAEMKATLDAVGQMQGGGYTDPMETGVNSQARAAFYASPLFADQAPAMKTGRGNIDYPDEPAQSPTLDKRQMQAIAIRSGGAVGGPEVGKTPSVTGGQTNPIIPKVPVTGGGGSTASVFSTVSITAKVGAQVSSVVAANVSARVSVAVR